MPRTGPDSVLGQNGVPVPVGGLGTPLSPKPGLQPSDLEAGCWRCHLSLIFSNGISKFDFLIPAQISEEQRPGLQSQVGVGGVPGTRSPKRAPRGACWGRVPVEKGAGGEWLGPRRGPLLRAWP